MYRALFKKRAAKVRKYRARHPGVTQKEAWIHLKRVGGRRQRAGMI